MQDVSIDRDLVDSARSGSKKAFAELVERHRKLAFGFAFALTRSVSLSEEIAQEAFVAAWRRLPEMERPERFRGWLCGIVRNVTLRWTRNERAQLPGTRSLALMGNVQSSDPSPLEQVISRQEGEALWRALGDLPETYRLPLVLYYVNKQSIEEVADALEVSLESTRQRLSRGRRILQDQVPKLLESLGQSRPHKEFVAGVIAALSLPALEPAAHAQPRQARPRARPGRLGMAAALAALPVALSTWSLFSGPRALPPRPAVAATTTESRPPRPAAKIPDFTPPVIAATDGVAFAATTTAGGDPAPPPSHEASVVMSFDFEDGVLPDAYPRAFDAGQIVSGPCAPGSRYCVLAGMRLDYPSIANVIIRGGPPRKPIPMFDITETTLLSFDYWIGADADQLLIEINLLNDPVTWRAGNYDFVIRRPTPEMWTHVAVRMLDFVPVSCTPPGCRRIPPESGDGVRAIDFWGARTGSKPLYLDNIRVVNLPRGGNRR